MTEIKTELLKLYISNYINHNIKDFEIDVSEIANTTAIKILAKIQKILANENYTDFEIVEETVCLFEKYKLDFGYRHDF